MNGPIIVFGGDGYIGWPLSVHLAARIPSEVVVVDNMSTRLLVRSVGSESLIPIGTIRERVEAYREAFGRDNLVFEPGDARDAERVDDIIRRYRPEAIVHLAQQRSAPFSMVDQEHAVYTQVNNVVANMNILYSMARHAPSAHLLKMGTMGEYGTPGLDITEGDVELEVNGRRAKVMYPRFSQSWYHMSKIFDTYNVMLANRIYGIRATDIMQGVVYGTRTDEVRDGPLATRLDMDSTWGTVINKYVVQAVALGELLIYGKGRQTRGFLSLYDSINAMTLLLENPPREGEYRVVNQLDYIYDTIQLADAVEEVAEEFGVRVGRRQVENPRVEKEEHYYNVEHRVLPSLGFERRKPLKVVVREIFEDVIAHRERAYRMRHLLYPNVRWRDSRDLRREDMRMPQVLLEPLPPYEVERLAGELAEAVA